MTSHIVCLFLVFVGSSIVDVQVLFRSMASMTSKNSLQLCNGT